mmetsp:Transcript_24336/g.40628  ORF Transcript_24336/g.40628 Transcript_24336/m.40628 type:complete len:215 (-) Transcript_24336:340-984(-)
MLDLKRTKPTLHTEQRGASDCQSLILTTGSMRICGMISSIKYSRTFSSMLPHATKDKETESSGLTSDFKSAKLTKIQPDISTCSGSERTILTRRICANFSSSRLARSSFFLAATAAFPLPTPISADRETATPFLMAFTDRAASFSSSALACSAAALAARSMFGTGAGAGTWTSPLLPWPRRARPDLANIYTRRSLIGTGFTKSCVLVDFCVPPV